MPEDNMILKKRVLEMADKSYRNHIYLFTPFLTPAEFSDCVEELEKNHYHNFDSDGGTAIAERKVIRFGKAEEFGYDEPYPIVCLVIEPNLAKFAETLSHRDYLGSILNLGIDRNVLGDIIIRGKTAYVICLSKIAEYISENLLKIRHTNVTCTITDKMPAALEPVLETEQLSVSSERCDMIAAKVYRISRAEILKLFHEKKVCLNSRVLENNSKQMKEGDIISVRGYGKFIYDGVQSISKKEKLRVTVRKYV